MTFAVTGFGGCGSKFIADTLNKSETFEVRHEPKHSFNYMTARYANARFNKKTNYGEVNTYLRFCFDDIKAKQKAIIVRSPLETFISWHTNKQEKNGLNPQWYANFEYSLQLLDGYINKYPVFVFEKLISDRNQIMNLAGTVNIKDLKLKDVDLSPKNQHRKKDLIKNITDAEYNLFYAIAKPFIIKHEHLWT